MCHPLQEAQTIIALLQPAPNAHLVNKLGPLADSSAKGWRDRFTHIREVGRSLEMAILQSRASSSYVYLIAWLTYRPR